MSYPVYAVPSGDVLPVFFSSYGKTNGESITLTGLAVTDIEIYRDGSTTQRASDAGYTLLDTDGIDFDGITGIHGFSIDTGDNTDAGFYTVGAWFHVIVSAVTVDSQTVNFIACAFRLLPAEASAGVAKTQLADGVTHGGTTAKLELGSSSATPALLVQNSGGDAARLLSSGGNGHGLAATGAGTGSGILGYGSGTGPGITGYGQSNAGIYAEAASNNEPAVSFLGHGTGAGLEVTGGATGPGVLLQGGGTSGAGLVVQAQLGDSDGATFIAAGSGVDLRADITGNVTGTVATVTTLTGHTPQTGDSFARLGAPAGASVSADIAAVKTDTGNLVTRITSTLFAGITSLAEWLGLIAGKQSGNATARTELRATGAGSGTFDETTDSQEAIRDNMGTPQTGDSFARLGAPAGASVSADIAAIEAQTDDIGVAGAGLTAVPWNAAWDAEVQSEVQDAIEANHLDHLLAVDYDPQNKPGAADALLNEMLESDDVSPGRARFTAGALEQAPTGGSAPTVGQIADAVWEEAIADHSGTAGSTAEQLAAAGAAGDPWATALPGAYTAGQAGKIVGDNLNTTVSSRSSHSAADVWAVGTRTLTSFGTLVSDIWAAGTRTLTAFDASFKTGYALSSAGVQAIWDALTSALTTVGSIGKLLVDRIDAAISSRSTVTTTEVNTEVDQALSDVGLTTTVTGRIDAAVSTRATPAQVNAEVVDGLATDTYGEPAAAPSATASLKDKIGWLFLLARNKQTLNKDTGVGVVRNDADSVDVATRTDSDDNTTYTKGEWG